MTGEDTDVMSSLIDNLSEKAFDSFKKITPALVSIALLSGLILFLPTCILEKMSLNDLPELWKQIVGIVFLLSIALIGTIILFSVLSKITSKRQNRRIKENLKKKLNTLSPRQRAIIIQLLRSEDKTISLDKNSGDTVYLVNSMFLHMPQQVFSMGWNNEMVLTYVPQPWLLELYNEEPELFK
jgi:hypothetical protein